MGRRIRVRTLAPELLDVNGAKVNRIPHGSDCIVEAVDEESGKAERISGVAAITISVSRHNEPVRVHLELIGVELDVVGEETEPGVDSLPTPNARNVPAIDPDEPSPLAKRPNDIPRKMWSDEAAIMLAAIVDRAPDFRLVVHLPDKQNKFKRSQLGWEFTHNNERFREVPELDHEPTDEDLNSLLLNAQDIVAAIVERN